MRDFCSTADWSVGRKRSRIGGSAFTLIEMITVVAIICCLAALLFPAYAKAMARTRNLRCMQNLKQWSGVIASYSTDNDQQIYIYPNSVPPHWLDAGASPYLPYFSSNPAKASQMLFNVRVCPGDTARNPSVYTAEYEMSRAPVSGMTTIKVPMIKSPSKYLLMSDSATRTSGAGAYGSTEITTQIKPICVPPSNMVIRHGGYANVLWADFHMTAESYNSFVTNAAVWFKAY